MKSQSDGGLKDFAISMVLVGFMLGMEFSMILFTILVRLGLLGACNG